MSKTVDSFVIPGAGRFRITHGKNNLASKLCFTAWANGSAIGGPHKSHRDASVHIYREAGADLDRRIAELRDQLAAAENSKRLLNNDDPDRLWEFRPKKRLINSSRGPESRK